MTPVTTTYDSVDGVDLCVDLYLPDDRSRVGGVVLWFHGGALMLASRRDVPEELVAHAATRGFALVSADYRLAPQVGIDDIVRDAQTALAWVQHDGADEYGWDGDAVVAAGLSAGGYLALRTGELPSPPAAIVSWYGYGTLDSPWYTEPSPAHAQAAGTIAADEAFATIGTEVIVDGHLRPEAWKYYLHARQVGQWPALVAGAEFPAERERLRAHSPTYHVTSSFPPAFLLHGTDDYDVPYSESAAMAAMLALHGVEHELVSLLGFDHGLDPGNDPDRRRVAADATSRAHDFITAHVHA